MSNEPNFWVRDVPVYGDVILAPMAAYSDVPCRAVSRAYGSAMNYTEFVAADALMLDTPNPIWRRLDTKEDEEPVVFQIFGNDAQKLLFAAQRIEAWGPHIIDINMGCSVPKVSENGAGVGMMLKPDLVAETFSLLTKHLSVPITGKIRMGWDEEQLNYLEIAHIMEDNGASLVAIHGRTKKQKYKGEARWDCIAELKQSVSIPVIGNGDVRTPDDIDRMIAHTGCDAVMVGRAAVGNPWIFQRRDRTLVNFAEKSAAMRLHVQEIVAYYGEERGLLQFNKYIRRYFHGMSKKLKNSLADSKTLAEFEEKLDEAAQWPTAHLYGITWIDEDLEEKLLPKKAKEVHKATNGF